MVLRCEAGVGEKAVYFAPVADASVVEQFKLIGNDEGYYLVCKAFLEHYEPAYSAVALLERVDAFKLAVEVYDIFQTLPLNGVVCCPQALYLGPDIFWSRGLYSAYFIWQTLVITYVEPLFSAI